MLAAALAASAVPAAPPLAAPWVVTDEVTITGGALLVTRDVVIASGGHLRLLGVDAVIAGTPVAPVSVTVRDGGHLELRDGPDGVGGTRATRLTGAATPWRLTVEPGGGLTAVGAHVDGAHVRLSSEGALLADAHVRLVVGPLVVDAGAPRIVGGVLESALDRLVHVTGGTLTVDGATLRDARGTGVVVESGARLEVRNATLRDLGAYALDVRGGRVNATASTFHDGEGYAVLSRGGDLALRGNAFTGHCGVFLTGGAAVVAEGNAFRVTEQALTIESAATARVTGNTFDGAAIGVLVAKGPATVVGNAFTGAGLGVRLHDANATLTGNAFHGPGNGVVVHGDARLPVLRENAFTRDAGTAVENAGTGRLDARGNWWGHATGPAPGGSGASTLGAVDVAPWLTSGG